MEILNLENGISKEQLDKIAAYLFAGKVLVLPTDTVYGLSCLATDRKAIDNIYKIKKRPKEKAMLTLIKSYCMLHDYFLVSKKQEEYIRSIWPRTTREAYDFSKKSDLKATTFILKPKGDWLGTDIKPDEGIGVRLPKNELIIKILKKINKPIISTSLNISGEETIKDPRDIEKKFTVLPDLIVYTGISKTTQSSAIIDIRDMDNIRRLR